MRSRMSGICTFPGREEGEIPIADFRRSNIGERLGGHTAEGELNE